MSPPRPTGHRRPAPPAALAVLAVLAVLALPAPPAAAAGPAAGPASGAPGLAAPALRWPEVAAAAERQPLLREASARSDASRGALAAAGELPNPAITLSGGEAEARSGPDRRREWGAAIALPLDFLATRGPRLGAARALAREAEAEVQGAREQALRTLRRDFVALAHAQSLLEAQLELAADAERIADLVRRRAARGEVRPTEVPRAEVELLRLRSAVDRARTAAESRRQRLALAIGAPVSRVEADLGLAPALPPLEALEARLGQAPAIRAGAARVDAAGEALAAERRERLPKVALGASHVEELDRRASAIQATVTLPLWGWNTGRIRQAEAVVAGEEARLDAARRERHAAAVEAWHGCAAGQEATRRFRDEVLPRAEGAARTMGRAFELGEAGLLDVLDARRVLLDARREQLDLLLDMQGACGDLAALAGLELP